MSEVRYVKWPSPRGSVHVYVTFTRGGQVLVRCGRRFDGPRIDLLDSVPLDERTCETCLRFSAHDQQPPVTDDDATDSGPTDDEVTP